MIDVVRWRFSNQDAADEAIAALSKAGFVRQYYDSTDADKPFVVEAQVRKC